MTQKHEIGSQWETRGGWRAVVVDVTQTGYLKVWHNDGNLITDHFPDGSLYGTSKEDSRDLLRPWVEKRSGWVNVYEDGSFEHSDCFSSKETADKCSTADGLKRIACVKWTEGDGIDG